jgi:hypothetical protein
MTKSVCATPALLLLAACYGTNPGPAAQVDDAASPQARAVQGCASGQAADLLHQNRPGGSDFNAMRCSAEGY